MTLFEPVHVSLAYAAPYTYLITAGRKIITIGDTSNYHFPNQQIHRYFDVIEYRI